jgi:hypothetical protein
VKVDADIMRDKVDDSFAIDYRTSGSGVAPVARYPCNTRSVSCLDATQVHIQQIVAQDPPATLSLTLTAAVTNGIIGKTFKRKVRLVFGHPPIERIMQKEVRQQG